MADRELDKQFILEHDSTSLQAIIALYSGRYEAARQLAMPIVKKSRGVCEFVLGELCRVGQDCDVNLFTARDWYVSSSIQGYFRAHFEVGLILREDVSPPNDEVFGTSPDQELSDIYLQKAHRAAMLRHEAGDVDATAFLGWWNCECAFAVPELALPSADSDLGVLLLTQAVTRG